MKVTSLIIQNVGKIKSLTVECNKPLILFYGEIKQGKSTILNSVKWVCGGAYPDDIIRHGAEEASIELNFENGSITRSWYRAKDGTTKARAIDFIRDGKPVKHPIEAIKKLLNPFLLDQDFLRKKSALDRRQYFIELFGVDTVALDTELTANEREATLLRAKIKGYGEIELIPVEPVDLAALRSELSTIREGYEADCHRVNKSNESTGKQNSIIQQAHFKKEDLEREVASLETALAAAKERLASTLEWINKNPHKDLESRPNAPDTSDLETRIQEAMATNYRAEQYQKNRARADAKALDQSDLLDLERRSREIKSEKQAKLQGISDSCGIEGLSFDEDGNFIYQDTTAGMISDSQIMRLSSELSASYPEGLGVDLIDRGESLGRSIFEFVDRAQAEGKTIMATIVGECPAIIPANIGVFVVEEGAVTAAVYEK